MSEKILPRETVDGRSPSGLAALVVPVVNLVGPTGTGKTAIIEAIAKKLTRTAQVAAIIGSAQARRCVQRLAMLGIQAVELTTDHPTARDIQKAAATLDLKDVDLLFIESTGNGISSADLGSTRHVRIAVFSIAGGDERVAEHAGLVQGSDLVLLTKMDLLQMVDFNLAAFTTDLSAVHPLIESLHVSGRDGSGIAGLIDWILLHTDPTNPKAKQPLSQRVRWFHGGDLD